MGLSKLLFVLSRVNEIQACQNVYWQEEKPEEAAAAGEDGLLHTNTIEDCELRSLLIKSIYSDSLTLCLQFLPGILFT